VIDLFELFIGVVFVAACFYEALRPLDGGRS